MVGKILLCILMILLFVLFCPAELHLRYHDQKLLVRVRLFGLLRLRLWPQKAKKPKKAKPQKAEATEKPGKPKPKKEPVPLMDTLGLVSDLMPDIGRLLGFTLRHTTVRRLRVRATVTGADAAQTAIRYGQMNALAYNLYVWLAAMTKLRECKIALIPNFTAANEELLLVLRLRASPAILLWGMLRLAGAVFSNMMKTKNQDRTQKQKKDGTPLCHKPQSAT